MYVEQYIKQSLKSRWVILFTLNFFWKNKMFIAPNSPLLIIVIKNNFVQIIFLIKKIKIGKSIKNIQARMAQLVAHRPADIDIIKILNLYIILLCTQLYNFFLASIHYLQCVHCLLPTIKRILCSSLKR